MRRVLIQGSEVWFMELDVLSVRKESLVSIAGFFQWSVHFLDIRIVITITNMFSDDATRWKTFCLFPIYCLTDFVLQGQILPSVSQRTRPWNNLSKVIRGPGSSYQVASLLVLVPSQGWSPCTLPCHSSVSWTPSTLNREADFDMNL